MQALEAGEIETLVVQTTPEHSAEAMGNEGVAVVATPSVLSFVERTCGKALERVLDEGEASVGIAHHIEHVAAAPVGSTITVTGRIEAVLQNRVLFAVTVSEGERVLLHGTHSRAVVDLARFLAGSGERY